MSEGFRDHFSTVAGHYADSRPTYPDALFDWLTTQCVRRDAAWDCGAGSGQASRALAARFGQVIATDASEAQLAQALPHPNVTYRVAAAEDSGIEPASVDLVTVAQALHWFDLPRFYAEVQRVLRPGGVVAAWSYGILRAEGAEVDRLALRFYREDVGPYWPPERRIVENGYRDLAFPFAPLDVPPFVMRTQWRLDQLLGYFRSWSATARFIERNGHDPVARLEPELRTVWGDPDQPRRIEWPLALLAGRMTPT